MEKPKPPADEAQRLEALRRLKILDTAPEERFDRLTRLAQSLLGVPTAFISLVDAERQWFKSRQGLDLKETPRDVSFCAHAIMGSEPFIVPDASKDPRFADNPLVVSAPNIRFYAGAPLRLSTGETVGMLCVLDRIPRTLDARRLALLLDLGVLVRNELEGASLDAALSAVAEKEGRRRELLDEKEGLLRAAAARERAEKLLFARLEAAEARAEGAAKELRGLEAALDASALASATDADGRLIAVNDRFVELTGYAREELLGVTHKLLNSGTHPDAFFKDLWETIASGRVWRGEIRNLSRSGAAYWVDTTITPFPGEDGKPVRYVAISHDVTGRKLAEARAAEADARLQAVLDGADLVAVIAAGPDGLITLFSRGAESLLGCAASEALGRPASSLAADGDGFDALVESARGGGPVTRDWDLARKDGTVVPVRLSVTARRGPKGEADGFLALAVDVTPSRLASAESAKARDAARELADAKTLLFSNVSRRVRAPASAVDGLAGLLLDTGLDPRQRELAEGIRAAGDALLETLGGILDFSRLEAGALPLEEGDVDPRLVVEDVALLFAAPAREKGLELSAFVDEALPPRLRGDAGRLRQVLAVFAGNAVKFASAGEIVIAARAAPGAGGSVRLRFEVQDAGPGIDPAAQAGLFAGSRAGGGAGLGLAVCGKLAEMMGGAIGVVSVPGKGSTFWFEAPLPKGDAAPEACAPELAGVRVLIADAGEASRRVAAHLAASWRMRPQAAADGAAALAALRAAESEGDPFILAIIDERLPDMEGAQLAEEIKGDAALVAVRTLPLEGALAKPLFKSALHDAVCAALGVPASAQASALRALKAEPLASWRELRILLADDNAVDRRMGLLRLRALGCEAAVAADGREAVAASAAVPYDLVLMDCRMPELDGFEATAALRARPAAAGRGPVIIAMTAALERDRERCLAAGMDDALAKPVRGEDLAAALDRWFGPVDPAALQGLRELRDDAAVLGIIEAFAADAQGRLAGLRAAAGAGDAAALEAAASALKGGASTIGAKGVARLAARLEALARERRLDEAAPLAGTLDGELASALRRLREGALRST